MATENLAPDTIAASANLSGVVGSIDESPDSPDASWLTRVAQNAVSSVRTTFPTPSSGSPTTGAGLQTFRAFIRLSAVHNNTGSATWQLFLFEGGSVLNGGTAISSGALTNTSGQLVTGTWDAALLSNSDGSGVECRVVMNPETSGRTSDRGVGEVGAIEWVADVSQPATELTQTKLSDSDELNSHIVSPTAHHSLLNNLNTIGEQSVNPRLISTIYEDSDSFNSHQATQSVTLNATTLNDGELLGESSVSPTIYSSNYSDSDTFGSHEVTADFVLTHSGLENVTTFNSSTLISGLTQTIWGNTNSFGTTKASPTVLSVRYVDFDTFGSHEATSDFILIHSGFENLTTFTSSTLISGLNQTILVNTNSVENNLINPTVISTTFSNISSFESSTLSALLLQVSMDNENVFNSQTISPELRQSTLTDGDLFNNHTLGTVTELDHDLLINSNIFQSHVFSTALNHSKVADSDTFNNQIINVLINQDVLTGNNQFGTNTVGNILSSEILSDIDEFGISLINTEIVQSLYTNLVEFGVSLIGSFTIIEQSERLSNLVEFGNNNINSELRSSLLNNDNAIGSAITDPTLIDSLYENISSYGNSEVLAESLLIHTLYDDSDGFNNSSITSSTILTHELLDNLSEFNNSSANSTIIHTSLENSNQFGNNLIQTDRNLFSSIFVNAKTINSHNINVELSTSLIINTSSINGPHTIESILLQTAFLNLLLYGESSITRTYNQTNKFENQSSFFSNTIDPTIHGYRLVNISRFLSSNGKNVRLKKVMFELMRIRAAAMDSQISIHPTGYIYNDDSFVHG